MSGLSHGSCGGAGAGYRACTGTFRALALTLVLTAGCAHRPPAEPTSSVLPPPAVAIGSAAFDDVVALAEVREWTVRAVTVNGDTLVGRVSHPSRGSLRIRLKQLGSDQIAQLERKEQPPGPHTGLEETRLLAGAAVGAMAGIVTGILVAVQGDIECSSGCVAPWAIGGAVAGLLVEATHATRGTGPVAWIPIWRRE